MHPFEQPEALRLADALESAENPKLHLLPYAAAELRRLHKENNKLQVDLAQIRDKAIALAGEVLLIKKVHGNWLKEMHEAIEELRRLHAENEALRADAERYRWLKAKAFTEDRDGGYVKSYVFPHICYVNGADYKGHKPYFHGSIDAAIDAARSKE